jgi:ABC-type lipoprotein export system ATPase subunit
MAKTPLIRLRDICKTYHLGEVDLQVLRGVSFDIFPGEYVALMGASGSGKSTLMNVIGCLDKPTSGSYALDGREVTALQPDELAVARNQKIGFVFQSFNLLRRTSALENVMMPLSYSPENPSDHEAAARAKRLLEMVGLGERLDHEPSQLSGGQQQRVAIARSLINHPPLLLADEPTGNLDSKTTEEILKMFGELNAKDGITLLLVTHEPDVAAHAHRVIRIHDGVLTSDSRNESAPAGGAAGGHES